MVSFHHHDVGAEPAEWQTRVQRLATAPLTVPPGTRLLLVAAHPDDETLGAAGLLGEVLDRGGSATVVVLTDGEASHPDSPTWTPQALAAERRQEVSSAVTHLGLGEPVRFLGVPDGHVTEHRDAIRSDLRAAAAACTWIAAPWRADGHTDHDAAGSIAAGLASDHDVQLSEYPIWFWQWGHTDPDALPWATARRLSLSEGTRRRKREALSMHRTQTAPLSAQPGDEALLSARFLDYFTGPDEIHVVTARA